MVADLSTLRWYRHFRGATGFTGRDAQVSLDLARAMVFAESQGWSFRWETDAEDLRSGDWEDHRNRCGTCQKRDESDHTSEICFLIDDEGKVLHSLGAVWDADAPYRRFTEANLALDLMDEGVAGQQSDAVREG